MADDTPAGEANDLAAHVTRRVEDLVELIRDRSLRPVLTIVGALVGGVAGVVIAIGVIVAVVVSVSRLLDHDVFGGRVWAADFLIGGILGLAGLFLLRTSTNARSGNAGE